MKKLTNKEEELLKILWRLEKHLSKKFKQNLRQNRLITTPFLHLFVTSKTKAMSPIRPTETPTNTLL